MTTTSLDLAAACARLAEIARASEAPSYSLGLEVWSHDGKMSVGYNASVHSRTVMLAHESGPVLASVLDTIEARLCPARAAIPDTITLPDGTVTV